MFQIEKNFIDVMHFLDDQEKITTTIYLNILKDLIYLLNVRCLQILTNDLVIRPIGYLFRIYSTITTKFELSKVPKTVTGEITLKIIKAYTG